MIRIGEKVLHQIFGVGKVIKQANRGFFLRVRFPDGGDRWLKHQDLTVVFEHPDLPSAYISKPTVEHPAPKQARTQLNDLTTRFRRSVAPALTTMAIDETPIQLPSNCEDILRDSHRCRRMIEAFRMGIVPYDCLEQFTFGRDSQIKMMQKWVAKNATNNLFLFGPYGSGKTHLLQYLAQMLLKQGYATASVTLDHQESPLCKPKRVFSQLVQSLQFPLGEGGNGAFRKFIELSLEKGAFRDHLHYHNMIDCDDELQWSWLECNESYTRPLPWDWNGSGSKVDRYRHLPGLPDVGTAANVYCYLISGLGHAAVSYLGLKGLVLFFDEAESMDLNRGINFLKALTRASNNDMELKAEPNPIIGLKYAQQYRSIPFIYRQPTGLRLVFAFTDFITLERITGLGRFEKLELDCLSPSAIRSMQEKLCHIYSSAYKNGNQSDDCKFTEALIDHFNANQKDSTRMSVKAIVESLDKRRFRVPG